MTRSGRRSLFDMVAGLAAVVGVSLLLTSLVEPFSTGRLALETGLVVPLVASIVWRLIVAARRKRRGSHSAR